MVASNLPHINKINIKDTPEEQTYIVNDTKPIRFFLYIFTFLFMMNAFLMIFLGNSIYSLYHNFPFFYISAKSSSLITPCVTCVYLGYIILLVSFYSSQFAISRRVWENSCMVNMNVLLHTTLLIVTMVLMILSLYVDVNEIVEQIYIPVKDYATDSKIQKDIDFMQSKLSCCGRYSYADYIDVEFTNNHSTVVVSRQDSHGDLLNIVLPSTCCVTSGEVFCTEVWFACKMALFNLLEEKALSVSSLMVSAVCFNLMVMIPVLLIAQENRKMKRHKNKDQTIMGQAPEKKMKA